MKFEETEVGGFESAIRGMRNPLASWKKGDSRFGISVECDKCAHTDDGVSCLKMECMCVGEADMNLMMRLIKGGTEHRKFLRQIQVWVDITAPIYWWKEFDTYKVGTVANSTSTMHKIASTPITAKCFEIDDLDKDIFDEFEISKIISTCERLRLKYIETKDTRYWKELIRWLPEGWMQTRTLSMNYENLRSMYHQRQNHKLIEWSWDFINWIKTLPYAKELIMEE